VLLTGTGLTGTGLAGTGLTGTGTAVASPLAVADQPFGPTTQITDRAGALSGTQKTSVQNALNSLYDSSRLKLFVTYVKDFSGKSPTAWADQSADMAGMGRRDLLLAVATQGRQYAVSVHPDSGLSDKQLDDVAATAIEPALRASDWAAAAVGAAGGYAAVLAGKAVPVPAISSAPAAAAASNGGGSKAGVIFAVLGIVIVAAVFIFFFVRRRGQRQDAEPGGLTLPQLEAKAGHLLVTTDDAIRTSEQELGFASAQFGDDAAAPFATAMDDAKSELAAAFKLRQLLDDDIPEDDATKRTMLTELIQRCENANKILDEQATAFDKLRNLEKNAPQMVAQLTADAQQHAAELTTARATLTAMSTQYAPSAVAPVAGNADEAASRLQFLNGAITQAQQAITAGETSRAAVLVQAAQGALDQASQLIDGVGRRASELTEASNGLASAMAAVDANIAEAAASPSTQVRTLAMQAQAAVAQVRSAQGTGPFDPLDALRQVEEANAPLDQALAGAREEQERQQRAAAMLQQAMLTARSSIGAASDFITTHRGAIGSTARTRVAEAQRHLDQAMALAQPDPENAIAHAQHAAALADQAYAEARGDVSGFAGAGQGMGGMFGGSGAGSGMAGMAGAILGGILVNGVLGGGAGSPSGSGRGARPAAPSYGGASTRGRHSVGGRF
jgi:uncharacterized membrane protein YgcG